MAYLLPAEFATKMVDAGEAKIYMSTRDTLIRAYMAGAILALAAVFAITIAVQTGIFLLGAVQNGNSVTLLGHQHIPYKIKVPL